MLIRKTQKILVKLFLFSKDKKKVLLLKNKWGYWDLPGGHLEFEETVEECLRREIKEEIGINLKNYKLETIQTIILNGINNPKPEIRHYTVFIFSGKLYDYNKLMKMKDDDTLDFSWFSTKDLISNKIVRVLDFTKQQLKEVLRKRKSIRTINKIYIKKGDINSYAIFKC